MVSLIETVIGMAVIFVSIAALCSAITEVISNFINMRARMLWAAMRDLVGQEMADGMANSHLVQARTRLGPWEKLLAKFKIRPKLPSYISPNLFFLSVVDEAVRHRRKQVKKENEAKVAAFKEAREKAAKSDSQGGQGANEEVSEWPTDGHITTVAGMHFPQSNDELIALFAHLPNESVRMALKILVAQANKDLTKAGHNIGAWFDESMSDVSAWYRRWTQAVIFLVAFCVAGGLGADAIKIASELWGNAELRHETLEAANSIIQDPVLQKLLTDSAGSSLSSGFGQELAQGLVQDLKEATAEQADASDATSSQQEGADSSSSAGEAPNSFAAEDLKAVAKLMDGLQSMGIDFHPYDTERLTGMYQARYGSDSEPNVLFLVLLWLRNHGIGFFITALAASLGAPFWFGVLNRLVPMRLAGDPPKPIRDAAESAMKSR
ncbi:MAG: hypothetical protein AAGD01_07625 [Acidobacteriota bacterium]